MSRFPQLGETWFDCHICGFTFPVSDGIMHYRKKRLVDAKCADDIARDDYESALILPAERTNVSPQPVKN